MSGNLAELINVAAEIKPAFDESCNQCGWCCLTEICPVGEYVSGSSQIPCELLIQKGNKHYCSLADDPVYANLLAIGTGCDAITQTERFEELGINVQRI